MDYKKEPTKLSLSLTQIKNSLPKFFLVLLTVRLKPKAFK